MHELREHQDVESIAALVYKFVDHHLVQPKVHRRLQCHVQCVYTVVYELTKKDLVIASSGWKRSSSSQGHSSATTRSTRGCLWHFLPRLVGVEPPALQQCLVEVIS